MAGMRGGCGPREDAAGASLRSVAAELGEEVLDPGEEAGGFGLVILGRAQGREFGE
jgi:hypothetical protein